MTSPAESGVRAEDRRAMDDRIRIAETFTSLQGESTYAGLPCFFVRLAGCNLRCRYCDTPAATGGGREAPVSEVVSAFRSSGIGLAEITGGEPLLQAGFLRLATELKAAARTVLVETNGSLDISVIPEGVVAIMDLKCPGSGSMAAMDFRNVGRLRPYDETKFVIGDRNDFEWACAMVREHRLDARCRAVLFGPVAGVLDPSTLGGWILESGMPVRLQIQLHKRLGMP
jgi:7-carboxy-7-deazaguanine synthase